MNLILTKTKQTGIENNLNNIKNGLIITGEKYVQKNNESYRITGIQKRRD